MGATSLALVPDISNENASGLTIRTQADLDLLNNYKFLDDGDDDLWDEIIPKRNVPF